MKTRMDTKMDIIVLGHREGTLFIVESLHDHY